MQNIAYPNCRNCYYLSCDNPCVITYQQLSGMYCQNWQPDKTVNKQGKKINNNSLEALK